MQLNHSCHTPLYYQLRQMIRNNIVDGVWQDGMMLPSETQLAKTIEKGIVSADAHVAKRLRLNVGDEVACIKRVRYINDLASIIQTVYIKKEYVGELLNIDSSAISWHKYNEGDRANGRLFLYFVYCIRISKRI